MAFSFMRKYEKPIMFVIVVFCLSTIGVTGAMMQFFSPSQKSQTAATFEVVPGQQIKVSEEDYLRVKRDLAAFNAIYMGQARGSTPSDDDTLTHIVQVEEAKAAGIVVPDDEVSALVKMRFQAANDTQYRMQIRAMGFGSASEFEDTIRDELAVIKLQQLTSSSQRVTSEEIYDSFKKKAVRLSTEYVAYKASDRMADMNPLDYKTPDVKKWYEDHTRSAARVDAATKAFQDKYKTPEKLDFEVVWADFAEFDPTKAAEWLKDKKIEDSEARVYYDAHPDYFTVEAEKPKDAEKPSDDKAKEGEKKDEAKPAETPKAKPFDDVKEEIRTRLLAQALVQKALDEANQTRADKKPVLLDQLATKYGLQYQKLSGIEKPKLDAADLVGSKNLASELSAQTPSSFPTSVTANRPDRAYFTRIIASIPARTMPFDDVEPQVRNDYMIDKAMEKAIADANELKDEIEKRAKAKTTEPEDLAAWEKEQEEKKKNGVDLAAESKDIAIATRNAEMQKKKNEFAKQWQKETGATFDDLVKERGLQTGKLESYTVVARTDDSVKDEKDTVKKFFRTNHLLDPLDPGMCASLIMRDEENHVAYVSKLVKKEEPAWSELTTEDVKSTTDDINKTRAQRQQMMMQVADKEDRFRRTKLQSRHREQKPVVGGIPKP
jgi:hypothetical protein